MGMVCGNVRSVLTEKGVGRDCDLPDGVKVIGVDQDSWAVLRF
jgi:hypothetical protein